MSKERQQKRLVPELRFPKFQEEWKEKELIEITDKKVKWSFTGGPFGSSLKSSDYVPEENGVRIIQLQNIGDGQFRNDYKIFTSKKKADDLLSNNIYPGEIIMSKMGDPVGRACLIPDFHERYLMASDGIRVVVDENKYDKYFIYSLINSKQFRAKIENSSTGSTRKRIGLSILRNLTLSIPVNKQEQQKIAATLTSLDNLIAAENEKLDALQAHKKGLLQQLFPAQGEKVPGVRFEEFEQDGEWVQKKLGDIGKPLMCKRIFKEQTTTDPENAIPFYKIGTFGKDADAYIPIRLYNEYKRKYSYPNVGDILISASGTIGRLLIYDGADSYYQDSNIVWLGHDETEVINSYLYYCYSTLNWQTSDGGVIKRLYNSNIKEMEFFFPKDKLEQQKIAATLNSLDNLIAVQSEKTEALKAHKDGLMQGIFPNLNMRGL